jgi:hypothetical protein
MEMEIADYHHHTVVLFCNECNDCYDAAVFASSNCDHSVGFLYPPSHVQTSESPAATTRERRMKRKHFPRGTYFVNRKPRMRSTKTIPQLEVDNTVIATITSISSSDSLATFIDDVTDAPFTTHFHPVEHSCNSPDGDVLISGRTITCHRFFHSVNVSTAEHCDHAGDDAELLSGIAVGHIHVSFATPTALQLTMFSGGESQASAFTSSMLLLSCGLSLVRIVVRNVWNVFVSSLPLCATKALHQTYSAPSPLPL